jgi:hypothetical protein
MRVVGFIHEFSEVSDLKDKKKTQSDDRSREEKSEEARDTAGKR